MILIGGLSFVFVSLFGISLQETMPWIANGIIIWNYISMLIDESTEIFNKPILSNIKITAFELTLISVFKNLIILAHNSVIIVLVIFIFKIPLTNNLFFLFYGFLIIFINSLSATILIGMICIRFRDFILIVKNLLYLLFLMTPIFWMPSILTDNRILLADVNILYQIIQTIRDPILGNALSNWNIIYTLSFTSLTAILSFLLYNKYSKRIVYWI